MIGVTYVDGVKAGQSYVYQPELVVQPEKELFIGRILSFHFNESHAKNHLALNTLQKPEKLLCFSGFLYYNDMISGC